MDIKKRANQIAHRFQSRNPFEIVRGLNVILVDAPLSGVRGFYQYFQRNHIIYLDETLSEQERTLVLAHELGHLFLHKKANAIFMDTRTHLKTAETFNEPNRTRSLFLCKGKLAAFQSMYHIAICQPYPFANWDRAVFDLLIIGVNVIRHL